MQRIFVGLALAFITATALAQTAPTTAPALPAPAIPIRRDARVEPPPRPAKPAAAPAGAEGNLDPDVQRLLDRRIPDVNFDQEPLERVMDWVEQTTGVMVYVRWPVLAEAGIDRDAPVTVKARNRKLSQILFVILNEASGTTGEKLGYEAGDELLLFSTHRDLSRRMIVRTYDVKDIIQDVPNFDPNVPFPKGEVRHTKVLRDVGPSQRTTDSEGRVTSAPARRVVAADERMQEAMELMLNTIEPDSWLINGMGGRGTVFPYKGRLIVFNSIYVHELIAGSRE